MKIKILIFLIAKQKGKNFYLHYPQLLAIQIFKKYLKIIKKVYFLLMITILQEKKILLKTKKYQI